MTATILFVSLSLSNPICRRSFFTDISDRLRTERSERERELGREGEKEDGWREDEWVG